MTLTTGFARPGLLLATSVLLVAGCSQVVEGNALISVPRPGFACAPLDRRSGPSDQMGIPPNAECGLLSVPVDWDNADDPDGDVAQLALLRI
ncbi:alpha/beta hydrolase, partial [Mycobacterium sp. ITM-2017-0098]